MCFVNFLNICGYVQPENAKRQQKLYIDHNHKTGKIRGLLSFSCNAGLGYFKDDINIIENVINYLKKMERKLATIRKISNIEEISGADNIEVATIDGWKVVVKKNEFAIGSICIFCEIDSFLPIKPEYEFLRKSSYKKMSDGSEGFRLKTIKLRGQVSQGLILPISTLNPPDTNIYINPFIGLDVTQMLGIIKYEPPIPAELVGKVKGLFPSFIPKTDEERIQNLSGDYEKMKEKIYYATEKLDGCSATFYVKDGKFGVCSRNLELLESDDNTFWKVANQLSIKEKMLSLGINFAIQGECIGEGIQGNPYKIKGQTIKFFNAYNIDHYSHMDYAMFMAIMSKLELDTVPIIFENMKLPNTIEEVIALADDKSKLNPNTNREGLVIRSLDRKISFKAISNVYLLKNEK